MRENVTIGKVITSILVIIMFFVMRYLLLPRPSFDSLGGITFYYIFLALAIASVTTYFGDYEDGWVHAAGSLIIAAIIGVILLLITDLVNSKILNSNRYYHQLGTVEEKDYIDEIVPIDMSQIPYIDEDYAQVIGQKVLGQDPDLGSRVTIGEFNTIEVNGKLVLVAPLLHKDYFKWARYKEGTPGYIIISATNDEDVKLIKQIDGKDIKLKYQKDAFFDDDLIRHVRQSGYTKEGLTECTFELDDNGYPYWVITTFENSIGLSAPEVTGTIIVDPQTGDVKKYSIEETPTWVDIIQPKSFVNYQIKNWGSLVNGAFNFANTGKLKPTEGMDTIYNNGNCYYYTGITSYGSDDSTTGFILVNTRTKEAIKYNLSGANENAAQSSAEGEVQNLGYIAGFPLPVNIDGIPTYFLPLKDKAGYVKKFAFVNIEHAQIVGIGDNIAEAKRAYIAKVNSNGNQIAFTDDAFKSEKTGVISRIAFTILEGNTTVYMFTFEGEREIYEVSKDVSSEVVLTKTGDTVKISYVDDKNGNITVQSFENAEIYTIKSPEQQKVEDEAQKVESEQNKQYEMDTSKNEELWNSLTNEEKAKLLDKLNTSK